jgi:hypothetical protein
VSKRTVVIVVVGIPIVAFNEYFALTATGKNGKEFPEAA